MARTNEAKQSVKLIDCQNGGRWVVDRRRQSLDGNIYDHANRKRQVLFDGAFWSEGHLGAKLAVINPGCAAVQAKQRVASRHEIANARDDFDEAARALSNTNERFQVDGQDDGRSTEVVNGACVSVYRNRCRGNPFCPSHFGINALDDLDPIFGDPPDDG